MNPATVNQRLRHGLLNVLAFAVCYTTANLLAQHGGISRNVATGLDTYIPFVPWMVFPYALTGIFFVVSFGVVRSLDDLRVLSQRLLLATVLASLVFVFYPLQFSIARPVIHSPWWASFYAALDVLDRPYNQLPSLHVAYACIFWSAWRPLCTGRASRTALILTLCLVSISTVFTYQHHALDVFAGALLGWTSLRLVRCRQHEPAVAFYYTIGAGVVLVVGKAWFTWWLTGYIAVSLLMVARAYVWGDAHFLHKRQGRHNWWIRLVYAPYLLGYRLTWLCVQWIERKHAPFMQMALGLWVGRRLNNEQARLLPVGCTVVDLASELSETSLLRTARYHHVPLLDLVTPSEVEVKRVLNTVHRALQCGHPVYLHCAMGYSRSLRLASLCLSDTAGTPRPLQPTFLSQSLPMRFSIYQLKPAFQQLLQPLLRGLARGGTNPNQLTLATCGLMILYGAALALHPGSPLYWYALPLVLLARMALNALDGMLANLTGQKTPLGAVLNEVCDQVSDAALYLPFAVIPSIHTPLLVTVVLVSSWAEFTGLAALAAGAQRRFDGPMGKSDRAVAFGLIGILVATQVQAPWTNGVLAVVLILLAWTIRNRISSTTKAAS